MTDLQWGLAGRLYHVCVSCDIASWSIYSIMKTSVPWNSRAVPFSKYIYNNINDDIWFKSIILFLFNIKFLLEGCLTVHLPHEIK